MELKGIRFSLVLTLTLVSLIRVGRAHTAEVVDVTLQVSELMPDFINRETGYDPRRCEDLGSVKAIGLSGQQMSEDGTALEADVTFAFMVHPDFNFYCAPEDVRVENRPPQSVRLLYQRYPGQKCRSSRLSENRHQFQFTSRLAFEARSREDAESGLPVSYWELPEPGFQINSTPPFRVQIVYPIIDDPENPGQKIQDGQHPILRLRRKHCDDAVVPVPSETLADEDISEFNEFIADEGPAIDEREEYDRDDRYIP